MRFYNEIYVDSGSITGSFLGTSSYSISSSYALTASYVIGGGSGGGSSTGGSGSFTGSFTGSFIGDGSGLTGVSLPSLPSSQLFIGNISNVATATAMSGDVTISNVGVTTLSNSSVTNSKVATGIDAIKLANGSVTNTEFQYLSGSTSNIQEQLNSKILSGSYQLTGSINVTGSINITGSIQSPNYIDFFNVTGSAVPSQLEGRVYYDTDEQALTVFNGVTNTSLQVGQETIVLVKNNSGVTINNGSVVMVTGTLGSSGRLTVAEAVLDGSVSSYLIIGLATNAILDGTDGLVTRYGKVRGIDTTGTTESEVWNDGDVIYANSTTPTGLSKNPQASPNLKIEIGIVVHAASNGTLFVDLDRQHKLDDLYNITIASGQTGDLLLYNSSSGVWSNSKILSGSYQLTGSITGSFNGTFTGNGSGLTGIVATLEATTTDISSFTSQTNFIVTHNLNTPTPIIQLYDTNSELFIPQTIKILNNNQIQLIFDEATSGTVVIAKGGHIVSGSVLTSSYSYTSSYSFDAITSSYSLSSLTSSYSLNSSTASYVLNSVSSSYVLNAVSSSYALTASYAANAGSSLTIQNSGSNLSTATQLINFVGNAVSASNSGNDVTVTINTGSGGISTGVMEVMGLNFSHATTELLSNVLLPTDTTIHRIQVKKPVLFNGTTPYLNIYTSGTSPQTLMDQTENNLKLFTDDVKFDTFIITNESSGSIKLSVTGSGSTLGTGKVYVYYTKTLND